jgi:Ca-activated chloride channel family protein
MLVFMTDGRPTVSESNVEKIIKNAKEIKVEGLRLFTFGVGYDVNTQLLDRLAEENSGTADYIEPKEDLELKVSNFFTKVNSPVLTDLILDFGGVQTDYMYPRKLSDIFKGTQLTIIGRYRNSNDLNNITINLRGKTGRETRTFNYQNLDFPMRADKNDFLPRLWATRRVGWLIEQIRSNGENKELKDEIVDLGTRYGIVTPYTSYLATENSFVIDGQSSSGGGLGRGSGILRTQNRALQNKPSATTGQDAVTASKDAKEKQETVSVTGDSDNELLKVDGQTVVKKVGVKTFYLENGVWIDSVFKEESKMSETKLQFASNEYFDLIAKEKELAQFFSLGEQVVVVWKGRVYRVTK